MPSDMSLALPSPEPDQLSFHTLSGPQKAAIVARYLAGDESRLSLQKLPERLQADLVRQVASLGMIPPEVVEALTDEFAMLLENFANMGPASLTDAIDLLESSLSDSVAQRLRQQTGIGADEDPWDRIADKQPDQLLPVLEGESTEVAAVLLSKLGVKKAAELLGRIPGERARRITYAISLTSTIRPETVRRIGVALAGLLDIETPQAFADGPVERVGAILNSSRSATREDVLTGLGEEDEEFAENVRRAIFTFANIPTRVSDRDVPKILREVDRDLLVRAFSAAVEGGKLQHVVDFMLGSIPQRMADGIRTEMEETEAVEEEAGEAAMTEVIMAIRELEAAGEIYLLAGDD